MARNRFATHTPLERIDPGDFDKVRERLTGLIGWSEREGIDRLTFRDLLVVLLLRNNKELVKKGEPESFLRKFDRAVREDFEGWDFEDFDDIFGRDSEAP